MELQSKTIIVTGAANNIGRSIAMRMAREGANVVVHTRKNERDGEAVREAIESVGVRSIFVQGDLSDESNAQALVEAAMDEFGSVDILVNNAGAATGVSFVESTKSHWIESFNDNFFSAVLVSIEAVKVMRKQGFGKILNTSSIRGLDQTGREGIMAYSAAKAAMINFTKTLAKEVAPNILVNSVAPGFVLTPNYDSVPQNVKDEFIDGTLVKRWLNCDEIAEAFVYLAKAEGVTGEVLVVDGGFSLK